MRVEMRLRPTATGVGVVLVLLTDDGCRMWSRTMTQREYASFAVAVTDSLLHIGDRLEEVHTAAALDCARLLYETMERGGDEA